MILLGEGEWNGLLDWLRARALSDRWIEQKDLTGLRVAASPEEVVEIVSRAGEHQRTQAQELRRRATR